jgi:membrane-associated HD superfamily phosphohydrolase
MLADGIEATARTLEDPSPQRLEVAIDELIKKRFVEGELDECPLTLKDLTKIKAAFLNVMVGTYHVRVKYPEAKKKKPSKAEQKPEPAAAQGEELTPDERLSRTIKEIDRE